MKKIYPLILVLLSIFLSGQENNYKVTNLIQSNTNNGGGIDNCVFDNSGNAISIGRASGNFMFENETIVPNGLTDLFIYKSKISSKEKVFLTTVNAGEKGIIYPTKIFIDQFDDIYIVANFFGKIEINNNTYESTKLANNYILLKIKSTGETSWAKKLDEDYISNIVSSQDFTFIHHSSYSFDKVNRENGELITKVETDYYINVFKIHNNYLYISGSVINPFSLNQFNLLRNDPVIAQLDFNLNTINILKAVYNGNSISFSDFVFHENKIIFIINSSDTEKSLLSNNGISSTLNNSGNQFKTWMGKCDFEFKSLDWFNVSRYSPITNESKLFLKKNGNFYWHHNNLNTISNNGTTYNSNSKNTFVEFDQNANIISLRNISNAQTSVPIYSYANYNNEDFISGNLFSFTTNYQTMTSKVIYSKADNDQNFSTLSTYTKVGDSGYIEKSTYLSKTQDDNIYNNVNMNGVIPNYMGDNYSIAKSLSLFSKSKNGTKLWNIGVTNYDETRSGYLGLTRYGNTIDQNSKEETVHSCICFDTSIYIPKSCTWYGTNVNSTEIKNSALISKLDSDGKVIWQKRFISQTNSDSRFDITNIKYDKEDNIWIMARGYGSFSYDNTTINLSSGIFTDGFFIVKLDALGNFLFSKKINYIPYNNIYLDFDGQNNPVFLFNVFTNSSYPLIFDSILVDKIGSYSYQFIFLKLNSTGDIIDVKNLTPDDNSSSINTPHYVVDIKKSNQNIYIYGVTTISKTLNNISFTNDYNNLTSIISKINLNGEIEWSYPIFKNNSDSYSYNRGNFMETDSDSNLYLSISAIDKITYQNQNIELDKNTLENTVLKFDKNGLLKNYKKLGTHQQEFTININSNNDITLSGNTNQNSIDELPIYNTGGSNYLVFSLEQEVLSTLNFVKENILIYPNPTSNFINIKTTGKIQSVDIYDSAGRKVNSKFNSNNQIDVSKFIKGVYYIKLIIDNNKLTTKFIKN